MGRDISAKIKHAKRFAVAFIHYLFTMRYRSEIFFHKKRIIISVAQAAQFRIFKKMFHSKNISYFLLEKFSIYELY